jgi:hypothetical protein
VLQRFVWVLFSLLFFFFSGCCREGGWFTRVSFFCFLLSVLRYATCVGTLHDGVFFAFFFCCKLSLRLREPSLQLVFTNQSTSQKTRFFFFFLVLLHWAYTSSCLCVCVCLRCPSHTPFCPPLSLFSPSFSFFFSSSDTDALICFLAALICPLCSHAPFCLPSACWKNAPLCVCNPTHRKR